MSGFAAFLRGVNLGQRQVKSAELKEVFEALEFTKVRTLLASGNVLFETETETEVGLAQRIEEALNKRFGFAVGTVLRTWDELRAMLDSKPFAGIDPKADVMRYVLLFGEPLDPLPIFQGLPPNIEVVRLDPREIYVVGHRLPNGRYSEGMEQLDRQLPKGVLVTTRNWNTIEKAAGK